MESDKVVREQLLFLLKGGNAHMNFDQAVADFQIQNINTKPPNVSYTPWYLLEHLRIAQWDILEFIRDPKHVSPVWPEGYWPSENYEADQAKWDKTIIDFYADMETLQDMVANPHTNLYAPIPHAPDYTILREILLVADHNAYHIGEFAILRQVMNNWQSN
ncbi:DinB family protein [Chloroflexota bacterium]